MLQEKYYKTQEQYKNNRLIIWQKGESQNNYYKKSKQVKFSEN